VSLITEDMLQGASIIWESPLNRSTPVQDWERTEDYKIKYDFITALTKARTGLKPKDAQLRMAMALVYGKDISCVAATGFGKSLTYQMVTLMMGRKFGLIIIPLNALGEDQVWACKKFHIRACNLTTEFI